MNSIKKIKPGGRGQGGERDCFPNVLVPFTFRSLQPSTEVKESRKDAVHVIPAIH